MSQKKKKIAIVSFPWVSNGPYKFISEILEILVNISEKIYVINGNIHKISFTNEKVELIDLKIKMHSLHDYRPLIFSIFFWILKCLFIQFITSFKLFKMRNDYNVIIFYMAYPYFFIPLLTSKLIGKKSIEIITRSKPNTFSSKLLSITDFLLFELLNGISPESKSIITELKLSKYKEKILPYGSRYININIFNKINDINDRDLIGYIGRISHEKGIFELLKAIPMILKKTDENLSFLIIGDGKEKLKIKKLILANDLENHVKLIDWLPNETVPTYLNKLKLLILPTKHAEGLPTIILEAMACGTPVLTTNIGGVPDVIKNKITGFLMDTNNEIDITENVLTILKEHDLEKVSENSVEFIEKNFTFKMALKRWSSILKHLD